MPERTAFQPSELTTMSDAFARAIARLGEQDTCDPGINGHTLRRRIASGIVSAARHGVGDVEDLTAEGLRAAHGVPPTS